VSSLFPSTVHHQLYNTQALNEKNTKKERGWRSEPFTPAVEHLNEGTVASPIAQLYKDTMVIFMDIVGFTHWSSSRQPSEVFQLLETLYAKFDALAKIHRVFKIETIGDCYVAVVGLPLKRKRHAVVMATFAHECRERMTEVLKQLEESLGPVCYTEF
jgi:class 3 adenylate cyclase